MFLQAENRCSRWFLCCCNVAGTLLSGALSGPGGFGGHWFFCWSSVAGTVLSGLGWHTDKEPSQIVRQESLLSCPQRAVMWKMPAERSEIYHLSGWNIKSVNWVRSSRQLCPGAGWYSDQLRPSTVENLRTSFQLFPHTGKSQWLCRRKMPLPTVSSAVWLQWAPSIGGRYLSLFSIKKCVIIFFLLCRSKGL